MLTNEVGIVIASNYFVYCACNFLWEPIIIVLILIIVLLQLQLILITNNRLLLLNRCRFLTIKSYFWLDVIILLFDDYVVLLQLQLFFDNVTIYYCYCTVVIELL